MTQQRFRAYAQGLIAFVVILIISALFANSWATFFSAMAIALGGSIALGIEADGVQK